MSLMHSFSWHGPLTDILTGYAERYPMPSSPTLQTQRGAEGKSVVDELVDEAGVDAEAIVCDVVTPGDDVDRS